MLLIDAFGSVNNLPTTIRGACIDLHCGLLNLGPGLNFDSVDVPGLTFHDHMGLLRVVERTTWLTAFYSESLGRGAQQIVTSVNGSYVVTPLRSQKRRPRH